MTISVTVCPWVAVCARPGESGLHCARMGTLGRPLDRVRKRKLRGDASWRSLQIVLLGFLDSEDEEAWVIGARRGGEGVRGKDPACWAFAGPVDAGGTLAVRHIWGWNDDCQ